MAINARLILRVVPAMALALGLAAAPIAPAAAAGNPHGSVRVTLLNGDQEVAPVTKTASALRCFASSLTRAGSAM